MNDITITLTEDEAQAIIPQPGSSFSHEQWNRRLNLAEDAVSKIRVALREQGTRPPNEQAGLFGGS